MEQEFKDVLQQVMARPLKKYSVIDKQNIIMVSKMVYEQSDNINHRQARKLLRDLKKERSIIICCVRLCYPRDQQSTSKRSKTDAGAEKS